MKREKEEKNSGQWLGQGKKVCRRQHIMTINAGKRNAKGGGKGKNWREKGGDA